MAAALTNLKILKEINGPQYLQNIGQLFKEGILTLAKKYEIPVKITGPVSMTIDGDTDFSLMREFGERMILKGVYVHPTHNWFLSCAHKESDIHEALVQVEETFKEMR
jgi:glutamate-1-semialdehyde 2,1-aminomutase